MTAKKSTASATGATTDTSLNGGGGLQNSAESIFKLAMDNGLKFEDVEIPELGTGVKIRVRELTGFEREQFDRKIATVSSAPAPSRRGKKKRRGEDVGGQSIEYHVEKIRLELCFMCCINEKGGRLFETEAERLQLGNLSAQILERMFKRIMILSDMSEEEPDDDDEYDDDEREAHDPVAVARGES